MTLNYKLLVPGWTFGCFQNCFKPSWYRFNKVLETFLRDFRQYWHDGITHLMQICWLNTHNVDLLFYPIPQVLYWIETWSPWNPFEKSNLYVMCKKPVRDDLSFVFILLETATRGWAHCSYKWMDTVSKNTQLGCSIKKMFCWKEGAKINQEKIPHAITEPPGWTLYTKQDGFMSFKPNSETTTRIFCCLILMSPRKLQTLLLFHLL